MYHLELMAAAAYLLGHSGVDPLALVKRPPQAAGEGSQVPNLGSQRLPVAKAAGFVAVGGRALEPQGLVSARWFQELDH